MVAATGQAFWLKKRELRQIEIARKYESLKTKGQGAVDDYGKRSQLHILHALLRILIFCSLTCARSLFFSSCLQLQKSASAPRRRTTASSHAADGGRIEGVCNFVRRRVWFVVCASSPMGCTSTKFFVYFLLNPAINEANAAYGHELP